MLPCSNMHPTVTHTHAHIHTCTASVIISVFPAVISVHPMQRRSRGFQKQVHTYTYRNTCASKCIQHADTFRFQQFGFLYPILCQHSISLIGTIFLAADESKMDLKGEVPLVEKLLEKHLNNFGILKPSITAETRNFPNITVLSSGER